MTRIKDLVTPLSFPSQRGRFEGDKGGADQRTREVTGEYSAVSERTKNVTKITALPRPPCSGEALRGFQ
jgi:hypothetical protein